MDYAMVTGQNHDSSPSPDVSDLVGGILAAEILGQRDQLLLKVYAASPLLFCVFAPGGGSTERG